MRVVTVDALLGTRNHPIDLSSDADQDASQRREAEELRKHGLVQTGVLKRTQAMALHEDGFVAIQKPKRSEGMKMDEDGLLYLSRRKVVYYVD